MGEDVYWKVWECSHIPQEFRLANAHVYNLDTSFAKTQDISHIYIRTQSFSVFTQSVKSVTVRTDLGLLKLSQQVFIFTLGTVMAAVYINRDCR